MKAHQEIAFEESIQNHLVTNGWVMGSPSHYNKALGLDTAQL